MKPVIWLEGIVAAGKTTLARQLSESLGMRPLYEPVKENPYLEDFYKDPKRWAFSMQIHILHARYNMHQLAMQEAIYGATNGVILDRGLPGDMAFCDLHVSYGNISLREWSTYSSIHHNMCHTIPPPMVLLFLDVDPEVAYERVVKRDREAERTLTLQYLVDLRKKYDSALYRVGKGLYPWSRGIEVLSVPWNSDSSVEDLEKELKLVCYLGDSPCQCATEKSGTPAETYHSEKPTR